jgi:iron complex outermembrane receptor protein
MAYRSRRFHPSFMLLGVLATLTAAEAAPVADLKQLSIEELMNVEVTSVTKQSQKLGDAASAIQIVTDDDIRRSGATSIPEALRLADNLEVAQKDANNWAISARGFNASLADKLLVLVDGRTVYSPLYAGVIWNAQATLLEDVDRIEVISGPGGALWGANAVNGVINLTTKSAKATQGLYLSQAVGDQLQDLSSVRYGGVLAPGIYYRVYAQHEERGSEEYADGSRVSDSLRKTQAGFRLDSERSGDNLITVQGDLYAGTQDLGVTGEGVLSGANLLSRWTHTFAPDSDLVLQQYYDRTNLNQPFAAVPAALPAESGFPASQLHDALDTYDVDVQRRFRLGELNKFVTGAGYRVTRETDRNLNLVQFHPEKMTQQLLNAFVQDEMAVTPSVRATVGSKVEHNDYSGFEFEPDGRLEWNATAKQLLWGAVSRAVRTPSRFDRDLAVQSGLQNPPPSIVYPSTLLQGSKNFRSETEMALEIGYRVQVGAQASVAASGFYNDYDHLRSTSVAAVSATYPLPYPVYFQNNLEGHTEGLELTANYQVLDWWRLHAGADFLSENIFVRAGQTDATGGLNETADPRRQYFFRSAMDLPSHIQVDAAVRWIGSFVMNQSPTDGPVPGTVPSYSELNLRVAWQPTSKLELSVAGENLLHRRHTEYGFPGAGREQIVRGVYVRAEFRR